MFKNIVFVWLCLLACSILNAPATADEKPDTDKIAQDLIKAGKSNAEKLGAVSMNLSVKTIPTGDNLERSQKKSFKTYPTEVASRLKSRRKQRLVYVTF